MSDMHDHRQKRSLEELVRLCAAATGASPRRSTREVQTLVQAAGLAPEDVGTGFWQYVRRDWLDGSQDLAPFEDDGANEEYRFLAEYRGLLARCLACARPAAARSPFCGPDCAALWIRAKRGYYTAPPLSLPESACDALLDTIAGQPPEPAALAALRRFLDGRA